MPFPVRVFDKLFQQADFDGLAWQTNLYLAFEKLVDQTCGRDGQNNRQFGTSTTSITIAASGFATFTTQTNLKFVAFETRVFIVNPANTSQWMTGLVTSYTHSTGSLTVTRDGSSGSGTVANWAIIILPGSHSSASRLAPSADFGALGALSSSLNFRSVERAAVGIPLATHGFYLHTDFMEHADFARADTSGDWTLATNEPTSRLAYAHNSNEFTSVTGPNHGDGVQGVWSVQAAVAGRKSSLVYGDRGFVSAYEPGNFYLTAALKFSQTFASTDLYTVRFGLKADRGSRLGDCFSSGGLGFEIEETAAGKRWSAVFNNGSVVEKNSLAILSPLTTWAVCHIYGNMMNREVYFRVALSSTADANECLPLPSQYQIVRSLEDWPSEDSMIMHPCLSIEKISGSSTRAVFIDRMLLSKVLAR